MTTFTSGYIDETGNINTSTIKSNYSLDAAAAFLLYIASASAKQIQKLLNLCENVRFSSYNQTGIL